LRSQLVITDYVLSSVDLPFSFEFGYRRVWVDGGVHAHDLPVDVVLPEQFVVLTDGNLPDDHPGVSEADAVEADADHAAVPRRADQPHNLLVEWRLR